MSRQENNRQVRNMLARATEAGCTVTLRNGGHYKIETPDGASVFCASTPSDNRGVKKTLTLLRRHGVQL